MKKYSFPPIVNENSKVLILGTMPGEKSLQMNQYYANPMNQFWKIISHVINERTPWDYDDKVELLIKNGIAVWDVLMHCEREGSLDSNISDEIPNNFDSFFKQYSNIKAVYFNGGKAAKLFETHKLTDSSKYYSTLPSTSSANTSMALDKKKIIWAEEISKHL